MFIKNMILSVSFVFVVFSSFLSVFSDSDTHYVSTNGASISPYTNGWASAATNIQWAVDAATANDTVLVSNGVYDVGGVTNYPVGSSLTNRLAINKVITVRSANNNPAATFIVGAQDPAKTNGPASVRCVYLTNNSWLIGFTLTNGNTMLTTNDSPSRSSSDIAGGGFYADSTAAFISNCVIANNTASGGNGGGGLKSTLYNCAFIGNSVLGSGYGGAVALAVLYNCSVISNRAAIWVGGAYSCTLYNCLIMGNSSGVNGGGFYIGTAYNCTIIGNSASQGGGVYHNATLYNCIVYNNTAGTSGSNYYNSASLSFTNCCTAPEQSGWASGNITNDPGLVSLAGGNYRLSANSPCINAGVNQSWMTNAVDLDGRTRIRYGTVDMGAYERINNGTVYVVH